MFGRREIVADQSPCKFEILVAVCGRLLKVEEEVSRLLEAVSVLSSRGGDILVTVVAALSWKKVIPSTSFGPNGRVLYVPEIDHPAELFNFAIANGRGDLFGFSWPGSDVNTLWANAEALTAGGHGSSERFMAGPRGRAWMRPAAGDSWRFGREDDVPSGFPRGWMQLADCVPMDNAFVGKDVFRRIGDFKTSDSIGPWFWWEFCLRSTLIMEVDAMAIPPATSRWHWAMYPFKVSKPSTVVDASFQLSKETSVGAKISRPAAIANAADLADESGRPALSAVARRLENLGKLRVTIFGGLNEPAHNQLCFLNFFEAIRDWSAIEWRCVLDGAATMADVHCSDVVILSRVRSPNGRRIVDWCRSLSVPSIYMLDDNWISIGQEWDLYKDIFRPGAPQYDNFVHCLSRCSAALVYNQLLREDIEGLNPNIYMISPNIDLSLFHAPNSKQMRKAQFVVGYAGGHRANSQWVDGLCDFIEENPESGLVFMSSVVPDRVRLLDGERVVVVPYRFDYASYARFISQFPIDVMLAPLGSTRFESSKCPNKYLEITACNAVGLYSNCPLYSRFVRHEWNGFFVDGGSRRDWNGALRATRECRASLPAIGARAWDDVQRNYSTEAVLSSLLNVLVDVVERHRGDSDAAT